MSDNQSKIEVGNIFWNESRRSIIITDTDKEDGCLTCRFIEIKSGKLSHYCLSWCKDRFLDYNVFDEKLTNEYIIKNIIE